MPKDIIAEAIRLLDENDDIYTDKDVLAYELLSKTLTLILASYKMNKQTTKKYQQLIGALNVRIQKIRDSQKEE